MSVSHKAAGRPSATQTLGKDRRTASRSSAQFGLDCVRANCRPGDFSFLAYSCQTCRLFADQLAHRPTVRITHLFQQANVRQRDDRPEEKATSHIDRRKKQIPIPSFSTCPFMAIGRNMANVEASSSTFPFQSETSLPLRFFQENLKRAPKSKNGSTVCLQNSTSANYTAQLPSLAVVCRFPFN